MRVKLILGVLLFALIGLLFMVVPMSAQDTTTIVVPTPATGGDKLPDYAVDTVTWKPVPHNCFEQEPVDTRFPCSTKEQQATSGPMALAPNSGRIFTGDAPYVFQNVPEGTKAQYLSLFGIVELDKDHYPYSILPDLYDQLIAGLGKGNWIPVGYRAVELTGSETDVTAVINMTDKPIPPGTLAMAESYGAYWGDFSSADGLTGDEIGSVMAAQINMMVYKNAATIKAWSQTPEGALPYATINPANCSKVADLKQNDVTYCKVVNVQVFAWDGKTWNTLLFGAYNKDSGYTDLSAYLTPAPETVPG